MARPRPGARASVVEDARQEDVLGPAGAGGDQGGDRGRAPPPEDEARDGAGPAGRRRHQGDGERSAQCRVQRRVSTQATVKATNGRADSTIPRPRRACGRAVPDQLLDVAGLRRSAGPDGVGGGQGPVVGPLDARRVAAVTSGGRGSSS